MSDAAFPRIVPDTTSPFSGDLGNLHKLIEKAYGSRVAPNKNDLARGGVQGASALYIGEKLDSLLKKFDGSSGSSGSRPSVSESVPKSLGIGSESSSVFSNLMGKLTSKMDSVWKSTAIYQGFDKSRGFLKDIGVGGGDKVAEGRVNPRKNSLKKYGALGAGFVYLGEQLGDGSSREGMAEDGGGLFDGFLSRLGMRGGGRLGALAGKIGPALAAAGPWVALAGSIAGTAIAFKNEWDKEAESMGEEMRDVWQNENASFLQKMGVTLKNTGKGIFGALAGGVRGVVDNTKNTVSDIRAVWQDDSRSVGDKIFSTWKQGWKFTVGNIWSFTKGFGETIFNGVLGLLPDDKQEQVRAWVSNAKESIANFFGNAAERGRNLLGKAREAVFGSNSRTAKELLGDMKGKIVGFMGNIQEGVGEFFGDVKERGLRRAVSDRVTEAVANVKEFFGSVSQSVQEFVGDVQEDGLGVTVENRLSSLFEGDDSIIAKAGRAVGRFFGDVQRDGFGAAVGERIEALRTEIGGFFTNAYDSVSGFFTGTFNNISSAINERKTRGVMVEALGGGSGLFGSDTEAYDQLVQQYRKEKGYEDMNFGRVKRLMERDTDFLRQALEASGIDPSTILRENGINPNAVVNVDDAIITPDGKIVQTDPRDTLIAAQLGLRPNQSMNSLVSQFAQAMPSTRTQPQMERQTSLTMAERQAIMANNILGEEVVAALRELIDVTQQSKTGNTVMQQTTNVRTESPLRRSVME